MKIYKSGHDIFAGKVNDAKALKLCCVIGFYGQDVLALNKDHQSLCGEHILAAVQHSAVNKCVFVHVYASVRYYIDLLYHFMFSMSIDVDFIENTLKTTEKLKILLRNSQFIHILQKALAMGMDI